MSTCKFSINARKYKFSPRRFRQFDIETTKDGKRTLKDPSVVPEHYTPVGGLPVNPIPEKYRLEPAADTTPTTSPTLAALVDSAAAQRQQTSHATFLRARAVDAKDAQRPTAMIAAALVENDKKNTIGFGGGVTTSDEEGTTTGLSDDWARSAVFHVRPSDVIANYIGIDDTTQVIVGSTPTEIFQNRAKLSVDSFLDHWVPEAWGEVRFRKNRREQLHKMSVV